MKSYCDEMCASHGCNQGRDCPVRTGKPVRKVRAGGPPPADLPIQFAAPNDEAVHEGELSLVTVLLWLATAFCAIMAGLSLIWGGV